MNTARIACRRWNIANVQRSMHHHLPMTTKRRRLHTTPLQSTASALRYTYHNFLLNTPERHFDCPLNNTNLSMGMSKKYSLAMKRNLSTKSNNKHGSDCVHDNRISHEVDTVPAVDDGADKSQSDPIMNNGNEESLLMHYESLAKSGEVTRDPQQIEALTELDRLREECLPYWKELDEKNEDSNRKNSGDGIEDSWSMTSLFSLTPSWANPTTGDTMEKQQQPNPPKGIYLHGGVGCGKTYCMNLFFDSLPLTMGKQKVHFHKFMLGIHKQMHKAKMIKNLQGDEVIEYVIQSTLSEGKILCFDEFQVTDVADALILKRLFTGLINNGVVIVATSNRPPRDLYKGGLQRDLFLPFIDLLEETCVVVSMWGSETDYRLVQSSSSSDEKRKGAQQVYFVDGDDNPKGPAKDLFLELFRALTKDSLINSMVLDVQGREVFVPTASEEYSIARFSFYDLCGTAKGAADYLAISERFHTVFIEDVPKLQYHEVNLVRRWITLIDSLYECHVKLVIYAATNPEDMFQIDLENESCDEVFAFDRTRSRMEEMRSEGYLRKKWVGSQL
mmetsp:Transcript_14794/g.32142  ORF Transcript_14794/g.32142 Transcript_14794/m.32142 type:complete len:560 (-) Transcript_14794:358-2037(-)